MRDINRILLFGSSHEDPTYITGKTGVKVCKFKMYTIFNSGKKGEDGKREMNGTFFNVIVFGQTAEFLEKIRFAPKTRVLVEGRFEKNKYINKNGDTRYYEQVVATHVSPILPKKEKVAQDNFDAPEGIISFDDMDDSSTSDDEIGF